MGEPSRENVEQCGERNQADQGQVEVNVLELCDCHNAVSVEGPVARQDDEVPDVCERGDQQRPDGLVQLKGVVGGTGHQAGDDDNVGIAVVDNAAENPMNNGEGREKIESRVDCVTTSPRKKLAGEEGSEDDH